MQPPLKTVSEGRTRLFVPAASLASRAPVTFPVFFNPAARLNRDVSVAVASVTRPRTYLDALAGTGARGVRVAKECGPGVRVTMVDFNESALKVAARNVRANGVSGSCSVVHSEANRFLFSRFERPEKFEAVDIDPFGTPAPYVLGGLVASAEGAALSFTATDAAVLCGVYPKVVFRRYGASAPRSEFVHETALRILAGFAARMGGIVDIGATPLAAHSTLHYLRMYVRISRGASAADEAVKALGYTAQCNVCHSRFSGPEPLSRCPACGARVRSAGPLWTGDLADDEVTSKAAAMCSSNGWADSQKLLSSLSEVKGLPPFSYSLERSASRSRASSVPMDAVIERLRSAGFRCSNSPFEELSVKTDAGVRDVDAAVRRASGSSA